MGKTIILKIIAFIFFNSPLILSTIFILMYVIYSFRDQELESNILKAASVGILSVIITSVIIMILPNVSFFDIRVLRTVRVMCVSLILFTIFDMKEKNGIKAISSFLIIIFLFGLSLIEKMLM